MRLVETLPAGDNHNSRMASRRPLSVGICRRAAGAPSAVAPGGGEEFPGLGSLAACAGKEHGSEWAARGGARDAGGVDAAGFGKAPS